MHDLALIEDDADLREELVFLFEDAGYRVHQALNLDGLLDLLRLHHIHLILLDLNLPGANGYDIAKMLRQSYPKLGVIMLTARSRSEDRVRGYEAGADIYMTKPADPQELLAAVASLHRRILSERDAPLLALDCQRQQLRAPERDQWLNLTATEVLLLRSLSLAPDGMLETGSLLDLLEEKFPDRAATRRSLENLISRLRQKTAELTASEGTLIHSVRGVGYQLGTTLTIID